MLKNMKFFVFSDSGLELREIRYFKLKLIGSSLALGLFVIGAVLIVNFLSNDLLRLGYDRMSVLNAENKILKDQLNEISRRMNTVQRGLASLADRGNELRLMVDLSTIDPETREAAIGGTIKTSEFPFLSEEASTVLNNSRQLLDQLAREVKLQQASYEDIYKRYEYNKKFFNHLPAIKPATGYYSVNGFGMRVHPVLRVYRMHEGIDVINDVGTNIFCTGDGVVRYAGRTQGGYGAVVEISHGYGYSTLYAHLSKILVRPGQTVRRGELIAKSGRSGLVSGPHLHYEIRLNGRKQNPVDYFFDDVDAARYRTALASTQ
ncbi:MAG: Metalloendopeptidase-like protein [Bacteroidetes bacterium]|nr:Metalloendopeptidase-like protein [Bacteroidota bacterium]